MSTAFLPLGPNATLVAGGSPQAIELAPGSQGLPTVLYIVNNDPTYTACVNVAWGEAVDAAFPNSGFDGRGICVTSKGSALIKLNSTYQTQSLWISAIADGELRLFITPGVL